MSLKNTKIIATIITIIITILITINSQILSHINIFFPVNKSTWENSKILFTSIIIYGLIDYIIMYKYKIANNNFITSLFISSFTSIILYFIAIKLNIFNLISAVVIVIITELINYQIQKRNSIKYINTISFTLIIITYIIYGYFTYNTPITPTFYDSTIKKYGLNKYII